ncbi:MAG TPA: hypothetical protein VIL52_08115 [Bacteroidota bacterium]
MSTAVGFLKPTAASTFLGLVMIRPVRQSLSLAMARRVTLTVDTIFSTMLLLVGEYTHLILC